MAPTPIQAAVKPGATRSSSLSNVSGWAPDNAGSCATARQCEKLLKEVIDNPDRGWVGQRQSALTYAKGTRLYAYFALREKLSCDELELALDEIQAATKLLGSGEREVSAAQVTSALDLAAEVQYALQVQRTQRCR